uniref:Uncharacterized protein n=1 Tax=Anguilla anguilla TaxID=7936 RepID=A0A0E9XVM8_ANGAN
MKTAAGPSTSPAEGNGAADAVYSDVTDLQQGQATLPVDGNGDSSAAAAVYSNVAELQKDQGNPDTPTEENDSEELQYLVFSLTTPSLDPNRQQRRQLNPQSCSEQEENDKVVYASICKT